MRSPYTTHTAASSRTHTAAKSFRSAAPRRAVPPRGAAPAHAGWVYTIVLARPDAPSPGARSAVGGGRAGRCQPDEARITFDVGDDEDDDGVVCAGDFLLALASFQGHVAVVEELLTAPRIGTN